MIGDNGVNAELAGHGDFLNCGDSTIDGDEQTDALVGQLVHGRDIETIAFAGALRNIVRNV